MSGAPLEQLSDRERQLLDLASTGYTDTAIANHLGISETTVKTYWRRIRDKVGHLSRTELVANILRSKLESQVESRKNGSTTRDAKDAALGKFYRRLIEEAPDAILLVGPDGIVRMLNDSAARMFGWDRSDLRGKHISELIPNRYRHEHDHHVRTYIQAPVRGPMRGHLGTLALHKSGAEFAVDVSLSPLNEGEEDWIICIVRNLQNRIFGDSSPLIGESDGHQL